MITMTLPHRDVSCCLGQEYGQWSWLLAQPYVTECPGQTHGLPCLTLADGCLPLRLSSYYQEDWEGQAPPNESLVFVSPVHGSFAFCRLATQRIVSYRLLYRTGRLHWGILFDGEKGNQIEIPHSIHLSVRHLRVESEGTKAQYLFKSGRAEIII